MLSKLSLKQRSQNRFFWSSYSKEVQTSNVSVARVGKLGLYLHHTEQYSLVLLKCRLRKPKYKEITATVGSMSDRWYPPLHISTGPLALRRLCELGYQGNILRSCGQPWCKRTWYPKPAVKFRMGEIVVPYQLQEVSRVEFLEQHSQEAIVAQCLNQGSCFFFF